MSANIISAVLEVLYLSATVWLPIYFMGTIQRWIHIGLGRRLLMVPAIVGVPVHELSHYFAVKLFALCGANYKVTAVKLFQPMKDGTLGYVEYAYGKAWYTPFTNLVIGIAPLIGGLACFYLLSSALVPELNQSFIYELKQVASTAEAIELTGYLAILVWNADWSIKMTVWMLLSVSVLAFMLPSKADFQGAAAGIVVVFLLMVSLVMFFPGTGQFIGQWFSVVLTVLPIIILANAVMLGVSLIGRFIRGVEFKRKEAVHKE